MPDEHGGKSQFERLVAGPFYSAVVAANRVYLKVAVPDASATEREYWTLSCLPKTTLSPRRLSAVSMKTMETFVLHEPTRPGMDGRAEGFVIVRRSVLDRYWPKRRAFEKAFPGLTLEDCDYEDAGADQVRVIGWHDELIAALADERFAAAVRDLTASLLAVRTMQGAGHSYSLVDHVLGRAARPAEWIYPANERSAAWGDDPGVVETFRGIREGDVAEWHLSSCFHQIKAGDRIWVYATAPHQRVIAAGIAWSNPCQRVDGGNTHWTLEIRWDLGLTRFLLSTVVAASDVLEVQVQRVRALRQGETDMLSKVLADVRAPEPEGLPEGRRRRLAQVTARQGQADFRLRLLAAYDGRCAITGCDVEAVLQAAHISPYDGPATNRVTNGLLLRADLHNLFDRGYLWIDGSYRVRVAAGLDHYAELDGQRLSLPPVDDRPDKDALAHHRSEATKRLLA
ncbi:HNH endonuclease [Micromonospora sp. NPDC047187]|uniref:HNH endonuclease n=1 Tax=Micromonospora sp. NPDC047187 TaxID=3155262 RepID=UPI00340B7728